MYRSHVRENDPTRELKMEQEEAFQKQAKEKVQKQLKDGNVDLVSFLREPTFTVEDIQDSQPTLALENALTMEAETYDNDSEDDTDVDEPPPCPVHMM